MKENQDESAVKARVNTEKPQSLGKTNTLTIQRNITAIDERTIGNSSSSKRFRHDREEESHIRQSAPTPLHQHNEGPSSAPNLAESEKEIEARVRRQITDEHKEKKRHKGRRKRERNKQRKIRDNREPRRQSYVSYTHRTRKSREQRKLHYWHWERKATGIRTRHPERTETYSQFNTQTGHENQDTEESQVHRFRRVRFLRLRELHRAHGHCR